MQKSQCLTQKKRDKAWRGQFNIFFTLFLNGNFKASNAKSVWKTEKFKSSEVRRLDAGANIMQSDLNDAQLVEADTKISNFEEKLPNFSF